MRLAGGLAGLTLGATTLIAAPHVAAQAMREVHAVPPDCRTVLPPGARGMQRWQAFVALEHCDRIKRLQRLAEVLPADRRPMFFEGVVPAERLPGAFGVDVPVLRVVFPERAFFDTGRSELRPEAAPIAKIVAESLRREPPDVALFVAGHADKRGDDAYNEALSIDRASEIAQQILARGVALSSIWRIGFGEDMPLVAGDAPEALDRNRRVEFLFAAKPEAVGVWLATESSEQLCQATSRAEAERCKAQLRFRDEYVIEEERVRPPRRVDPRRRPAVAIAPKTAPRIKLAPVAAPARRLIEPRGSSLIAVTPTGARRIRIDPVNRRVPPVRIDL